jgi:hypothetical protein
VQTLPVTTTKSFLTHCMVFLKRLDLPDLLYVTTQRSVILSACKIFSKFLGDRVFQQEVIHIFTITFVIKGVRWYDCTALNAS